MTGNKLNGNMKNAANKQNEDKQAHRQAMSNQKSYDVNKNKCEERKQLQTLRNKRKDVTETTDVGNCSSRKKNCRTNTQVTKQYIKGVN